MPEDSFLNKVNKLALERFKLSEEAEAPMRQDGVEADLFYLGNQWPKEVEQSRTLANRPCLTINQLKKFTRQVTNDMRMNRPSVRVIPSKDSSEEIADILEGMVRHIQVSSGADIAYDTAGESAVRKGFGYFRVLTDFCDENSFDQEIKIKRIKNAFSVYFDPNCQEPDYSDAKYCFITEDMPREEFKKRYPKAKMADLTFSSTGDEQKDWQNNKTIRVAEYWEVVEEDDTLYMMVNGETKLKSELKEGEEQFILKDKNGRPKERETTTRKVLWRKITGVDILEGGEEGQLWPGKYIPVIPVLGEDLDVDGKRYVQGMIHDAMDPQRQYNYMSTAATEAAALAPKAPWIIAEGQIEGYEKFWENANTQTFSHLPYKPVTLNGTILPPPQRNTAEPPIAGMTSLIVKAGEDLKGVTGIYDAGLGHKQGQQSGKAITALQREGDAANFNYIDNLSRAIRFLGVILLDLIPKIYDAPRIIQITKEDDTVKSVHINTPLDKNENPVQYEDAMEKIYDLSKGKYEVTVVVGPSFNTKRQESSDAMMSLVQSAPFIAQQAPDLIVKALDFPMNNELADRLKKFLPPEIQQDDKQQDIPPQVKGQMQQMNQMIQQLTQALSKVQDEKDAKLLDLASKEKIAAMNNENAITLEAMKQEMQANQALMMAELQQIAQTIAHSRQIELQSQEIPQQ